MSQPQQRKTILTRIKTLPPAELIDLLISVMDDNNSAIIQASRWNSNESNYRDGLLGQQDYKIERARILNSLNGLVDDLDDRELGAAIVALPAVRLETPPEPVAEGNTSPAAREKIILFLSANPTNTAKLQLDKEYNMINVSFEREREYKLISRSQINWRELNALLVDKTIRHQLSIFHFSGHGNTTDTELQEMTRGLRFRDHSEMGVILYDDDKRNPMLVKEDIWYNFFRSAKKTCPELQILVFNTCLSESLARKVSEAGLYVIGVRNRVADTAALHFSSGFYAALSQGESLENAVGSGSRQALLYGLEDMDDVLLFYQGEQLEV